MDLAVETCLVLARTSALPSGISPNRKRPALYR